jgi:hypothetical protein
MTGAQGATGPQGPQGQQGVQGPPGAVLVVDGGVVVGPPGAGVLVTPIAAGGAPCPTGGVRITQLVDGGISNVCNGETGRQGLAGPTGATGATGPAGPTGATGPQGPAAPSLTVIVLPNMSPQCPTGGVHLGSADGGSWNLCNGAQGAQGLQGIPGPQGATGGVGPQGPPGATGPQGPAGPPGQVLYLDGGIVVGGSANPDRVTLAGYTAAIFNGNLGGNVGANAKCNAEFPGSVFCTRSDFAKTEQAEYGPAGGAWVDHSRDPNNGFRNGDQCNQSPNGGWTNGGTSDTGTSIQSNGLQSNDVCSAQKPLACCRVPRTVTFRGFTTALFNGNLGGSIGANAKCRAEFPGSVFCTRSDYAKSEPNTYPPSSGVWVDHSRDPNNGVRNGDECNQSPNGGWTNGGTSDTGTSIQSNGLQSNDVCSAQKPLACCQLP